MLNDGDKAPGFSLLEGKRHTVSLSDFDGQKEIIWFYPKASTPG